MKGKEVEMEESGIVVQRGVWGLCVDYRDYKSLLGNISTVRRYSKIQVSLIFEYTTTKYLTVVGIFSLFASLDWPRRVYQWFILVVYSVYRGRFTLFLLFPSLFLQHTVDNDQIKTDYNRSTLKCTLLLGHSYWIDQRRIKIYINLYWSRL